MTFLKKLLARVQGRRLAYRRCFMDGVGAPTKDGDAVLKDLARFCYAHRAAVIANPVTRTIDPIASAVAQGRHEVWLRITEQLYLHDSYLTNAREELPDGD